MAEKNKAKQRRKVTDTKHLGDDVGRQRHGSEPEQTKTHGEDINGRNGRGCQQQPCNRDGPQEISQPGSFSLSIVWRERPHR